MIKTVIIDYLPERAACYLSEHTIIAVDVVRATTTAISAVAAGRRCFPVPTVEAALELADRLGNVLLVGEQKGIKPPGFDLNNSPVQLLARTDIERPVVLLSSSGTRLCHKAAKGHHATFLACLRNYASVASHIAVTCNFPKVAVIGAGNRVSSARRTRCAAPGLLRGSSGQVIYPRTAKLPISSSAGAKRR